MTNAAAGGFPSYKVRHIEVKNGLVLSPMSGVTTSPFRRLLKELNPGAIGLVMTEFISVEGLTRENLRSLEMLKFDHSERPLAVQIFGYDIERLSRAAQMVEQAGADIVDLNCGCPAPKVVKRGGGCELMRQPKHLQKIYSSIRKSVKIPFSAKIRSGWDDSSKNALEIAKIAEAEGVEALAIHARTRAQLYRGSADWELVARVASELKIPVLGSGDVTDRKSALQRLAMGVRGLYIGRAAIYNPLVFSEILGEGTVGLRNNPVRMLSILRRYIELLRVSFPDVACIGKVKQLASQMCRGQEWRKPICVARKMADIELILSQVEEGLALAAAPLDSDNDADINSNLSENQCLPSPI